MRFLRLVLVCSLLASSLIVGSQVTPAAAAETATRAEVTRWYQETLNRNPDTGGLNFWTDYIQEVGVNRFSSAAYYIHLSQEFYALNASWPARVTGLYESVLDRSPDAGGLNWWVNQITSGARSWANVVASFAYSPEARGRFDAINRADCGGGTNIPAQQQLNASRNAMSGEGWDQVDVARDNRYGIVVLNAWIRGDDRQRITNYLVMGPTIGRFELDPDSDRGTTVNFQPNDSRATIVLDYASGIGYITAHSTTFRINLVAMVDPTLTRSAYTPSFDFGQFQVADPDPTWWWEDKPTSSRHRVRVHLTARPPYALGVDFFEIHEDVLTPSVDQQIYFNQNSGSTAGTVYYQGDSFPNISVYRYAGCYSFATRKALSEHADSPWAWTNMIHRTNWSYNNTYGRGI